MKYKLLFILDTIFANLTELMTLLIKWHEIASYDTKTNYSTLYPMWKSAGVQFYSLKKCMFRYVNVIATYIFCHRWFSYGKHRYSESNDHHPSLFIRPTAPSPSVQQASDRII